MAFQTGIILHSIASVLDISCPSSSGRSMGEKKQDVYCFNKMYKQFIPVSISLLLSAFPPCSVSSIQVKSRLKMA